MVSSTGFHAALCMLQRLGLEEVVFGQHAGRCISASPLAAPLQATLRALLVPPPQQPPRALHQLNPTTDPAVVFASHLMPMNPFVADLPPAACAVTTKQHAKVLREFKTAVESVRSATHHELKVLLQAPWHAVKQARHRLHSGRWRGADHIQRTLAPPSL